MPALVCSRFIQRRHPVQGGGAPASSPEALAPVRLKPDDSSRRLEAPLQMVGPDAWHQHMHWVFQSPSDALIKAGINSPASQRRLPAPPAPRAHLSAWHSCAVHTSTSKRRSFILIACKGAGEAGAAGGGKGCRPALNLSAALCLGLLEACIAATVSPDNLDGDTAFGLTSTRLGWCGHKGCQVAPGWPFPF